jgi:Ca2+-binding EF-hand superfamily protein
MPIPVLMLPLFAVAAQATIPPPVSSPTPVVVTGRGGVPFISPMGEPIRARVANEDTLARWFYQVDRNRDAYLTPDELVADATRYFDVLDTNHDGQIDPDELVHYEWTVAPEIQVNSRLRRARAPGEKPVETEAKPNDTEAGSPWGHSRGDGDGERKAKRDARQGSFDEGPQGAGRYALLNMPEPVAAADADFNRSITLAEFRQAAIDRFQLLDKKHEGRLSLAELEVMKPALPDAKNRKKRRDDEPDDRVGVPLRPDDATAQSVPTGG